MTPASAQIVARIRRLQDSLEDHLEHRRRELGLKMHSGIARFEDSMLRWHRTLKTCLSKYILGAPAFTMITAPFIYLVIIPLLLLDITVMLYQFFCFPVYGVKRVRRSEYFVLDRHHLAYLNGLEKLNCLYCSYANGLIAYVREVFSRTEQYWCPIKHSRRINAPHDRYWKFSDYGDAESYHGELDVLRRELRSDVETVRRDIPAPTRQ